MDKSRASHLKPSTDAPALQNEIKLIRCGNIYPDPARPPKRYPDGELSAIACGFRRHGIGIPAVVMNVRSFGKERFVLVTGEKIFRAALIAKAERIPCIVICPGENLPELPHPKEYVCGNSADAETPAASFNCALSVRDAPPSQQTKIVIKDPRFFFNSVDHAVSLMNKSGIKVACIRAETTSDVVLTITVPKSPPI